LPSGLHLQQRGGTALLVTGLVIFTAVSGTIDAGLIATRASHAVLIKNLAGSVVRIVALFLLAGLGSTGLLIAYSLGVALSTGLSSLALARRVWGQRPSLRSLGLLRGHLSLTAGNYLATIMGILPTTVVPLEVLVIRGAAETARFAIAFLIAGFLNVIPSTVATVLFAEASRQGVTLGKQLRKSLRGIYGLLLPAVIVVLAAAPLVLRLFGAAYAATATGCLRVLALSALLTGGTYLVDSLLIARDRIAAYIFMNGANAALVLGCVGALLSRGLTAAAGGWALAQGVSLLLGLIVLATGGAGRHRVPAGAPAEDQDPLRMPESGWPAGHVIDLAEPRIRELLATWPAMPTTMIAQRIGWDESLPVLLDRVSELRSSYLRSGQLLSRTKMPPGEIAQCAFWFPPVDVPVGFGQVRAATQLPVLTLITGYSRWLSAMLIPSRQAGDLFEAWWHLLAQLGAVPRVLAWGNEEAVGQWRREGTDLTPECAAFCRALGAEVVIGRRADPHTRGIVERAHVYLERSFLPGRSFASPANFNAQLHDWLTAANTRHRRPPTRSPAELIEADLEWMLPLPPNAPATGWHVPMVVGRTPFILFETNKYSVHRAALGRQVEVVA
ncbi:MAG TPA: hypothetical protein VF933_21605, partial [Streptosporangiaceae bacterium]